MIHLNTQTGNGVPETINVSLRTTMPVSMKSSQTSKRTKRKFHPVSELIQKWLSFKTAINIKVTINKHRSDLINIDIRDQTESLDRTGAAYTAVLPDVKPLCREVLNVSTKRAYRHHRQTEVPKGKLQMPGVRFSSDAFWTLNLPRLRVQIS